MPPMRNLMFAKGLPWRTANPITLYLSNSQRLSFFNECHSLCNKKVSIWEKYKRPYKTLLNHSSNFPKTTLKRKSFIGQA